MKKKYKKIVQVLLDDYEMYCEGYNKAISDFERILFNSNIINKTKMINQIRELTKNRHRSDEK